MLLSKPLAAKERKGADLIIQKTDGQQIRGELIAVKENSLLLMERDSGADVTVDIGEIGVITHVKKPNLKEGIGIGSLFGALAGLAAGIDKTIQIEGKSDLEIQEILENLRKKARVKNSQ